jgi:hypothetical protein
MHPRREMLHLARRRLGNDEVLRLAGDGEQADVVHFFASVRSGGGVRSGPNGELAAFEYVVQTPARVLLRQRLTAVAAAAKFVALQRRSAGLHAID